MTASATFLGNFLGPLTGGGALCLRRNAGPAGRQPGVGAVYRPQLQEQQAA